jgi:hypothetical protein
MRIWFNKTFSTIQAVFNNLRQYKTGEVVIVCTHTHENASAFLAADEHHLEPVDLTGSVYIEWCIAFCREHQIDIFWVGKEAALASKHHTEFEAVGTRILSVADYDTLTMLHDKARFYTELPSEVAKVMDFVVVNHRDEFDAAIEQLSIQHERLCIKPAVSVFGLGFRILDTQRDSITQILSGVEYQIPLQELRQGMLNTPQFAALLVMEHLNGHEWSVDCAAKHGELLCAVQRKKSLLAGHGQTIDNHPDIQGMVERLTAHYHLNGLFNVQFKQGVHGVRLLEINARPSGGFGMACLSGANLAVMALQAFKGETVEPAIIHYQRRITETHTPVILHD